MAATALGATWPVWFLAAVRHDRTGTKCEIASPPCLREGAGLGVDGPFRALLFWQLPTAGGLPSSQVVLGGFLSDETLCP